MPVVFTAFPSCAPQDMGKLYGDPQATAALRLGTMFHYGMVPFLGHNATEALAYYQEVTGGGEGGAVLARIRGVGGLVIPNSTPSTRWLVLGAESGG